MAVHIFRREATSPPVPEKGRRSAMLSNQTLNDFAREQLIGVGEGRLRKLGVSSSKVFHHCRDIIEESSDDLPFA